MTEFSPSGKRVIPSVGPLDAEIVLVAESPASEEMAQGIPLVGKSGRMLNKGLVHAGIDRSSCRIINCIPVRAPGDKFAQHELRDVEWAREVFKEEISQLPKAKVFVALGANPTEWLLGGKPPVASYGEGKREGFISAWRGSVIPVNALGGITPTHPEDYLGLIEGLNPIPDDGVIIPTFHPSAVLRQFTWHPWFLLDLGKANEVARNGIPETVNRTWYRNDLAALRRLADSDINLVAVDSELSPYIVGLATEDEVHVFEWNESYRRPLEALLASRNILKVAHRWLHDYTFFRKCLEIEVHQPIFDSVGGAQALNSALQKELSPHISTLYTNWPYHKWLSNIDQLHYCGMDSVVCYDSYWPMLKKLAERKLITVAGISKPGEPVPMGIVDYDHKVLMPLLKMQERGFKINEAERKQVEEELKLELDQEIVKLGQLVEPVIEKEIKRFKKPHLFRVQRKCECCGGGSKQKVHCEACWHRIQSPTVRMKDGEVDWKTTAAYHGLKSIKALKESFPECTVCNGTGKVTKSLPFNSDSPDQLADVVYRGLHIRPRKYKGNETVKAAQLDPLASKYPIVASIVHVSGIRAEWDTVSRLRAGADGALHCEFDPWGTGSGRVAGKEGLIEEGTNPMNLSKKARRFVVPRDGYTFIYPDMAQVEARAMAVLSGDKALRAALYEPVPGRDGPDYHTYLLNAIHQYDPAINLSRDQSKRVSYAGFYGARADQLAKELTAEAFRKGTGQTVDAKMAQRILDTLYRVCPGVPQWQQRVCDEVLRTRQLVSPTGRVFQWTGYITSKKSQGELDYEIKKQVWSRLPQDMGAYILGQGLIGMYYDSGEWGKLLNPLIHCHDALLIEVPNKEIKKASDLALSYLNRYLWGMDWIAEMKGTGENWYAIS